MSGEDADPPLRFRILGPIEIHGPNGAVRLAAHRQRIVLAMLLLEANRTLSVDRLIDAVWDDEPPPTAKSQIQICVSSLRRILASAGMPDVMVTQPSGYLLRVADHELDRHRFDRFVAQAQAASADDRAADAVTLYRRALELCVGSPLADVDSRVVHAASQQVAERAMTALETCIDLELQLGRHDSVIGELMRLVVSHPLRERLHAQLMLALYRSGRQAEALGAYRQARDELAELYGLEPGRSLRQLEHAILTNAPQLELAKAEDDGGPPANHRPAPHLLPTDLAEFAGRAEHMERLCGILRPDPEGEAVPIAVIAGRGGVGKTSLAVHVGHLLRADFPDGQLYAHMHGTENRPQQPGQILERFLRALGVPSSRTPDDAEERAELLRDRIAGRRVLIVLDDVASEGQVLPLLPGSASCAVLITARQRLSGLPNADHVDLNVFDEPPAMAMLAHLVGHDRVDAEPDAARELVGLCGHLPLAIRIAGARLAARPHWRIGQLRTRLANSMQRLDELSHGGMAVRPSIDDSYQSLEPDAQRLFRRLSLLEAPDFASWVAAPLLDIDLTLAEDLLESVVDVSLLDAARQDTSNRYHFHDLIRVYARERLVADRQQAERREALCRALSTWLFLAAEAHRRLYGGDYTLLHGTSDRFAIPRDAVDALLARPMEWLEAERGALVASVRQAADAGFDELCWDLAMTCVSVFEAHSHFDDWRTTHDLALSACRRTGNRRGEAAMLYSLGSLSVSRQRFTEAADRLGTALAIFTELGDGHGRALALRNLAYLDRVHGDLAGALGRYEEAQAGLAAAGDRIGQAHVLSGIAQIRILNNDLPAARDLLQRALRMARDAGSSRVEAQVQFRLGDMHRDADDLVAAEEAYRSVLDRTRDSGDEVGQSHALYGLGQVYARQGRYRAAEDSLTEALALAERDGRSLLAARVHMLRGEAAHDTGRLSEAATHLAAAADEFARLGLPDQQARAGVRRDAVERELARQPAPRPKRARREG